MLEGKSVLVDSNLLLLLVVGTWNPRAIPNLKRLSQFSPSDFELLRLFLSRFGKIVTTAHVLAEVSNLAGAASGRSRDAIFLQLAASISSIDEQIVPATTICARPEFMPFGLTDAALCHLCSDMPLITQDGRLARHLQLRGLPAWTLDQVRALRDVANSK